jgi:endonuclease/exonuclease/phosphatase family metal-dependent hydrolase
MKKNSVIIFGLIILALHFNYSAEGQRINNKGKEITILTYNVRNCRGLDNVVNYERVANVISKTGADIVALQELDSVTTRSQGISVLHELAKLTGMIPTYRASIDYQGGKYGIGILTRQKLLKVEGMSLPGREERRSVVLVEMKNYVLACTHFSLTPADRIRSVELIDSLTKDCKKPVFLAGDLNATPASAEIKAFSQNWEFLNDTTRFTIPANKPTACIDYIMARKRAGHTFKVLNTVVENEPVASDHLPVWVRLKMNR